MRGGKLCILKAEQKTSGSSSLVTGKESLEEKKINVTTYNVVA